MLSNSTYFNLFHFSELAWGHPYIRAQVHQNLTQVLRISSCSQLLKLGLISDHFISTLCSQNPKRSTSTSPDSPQPSKHKSAFYFFSFLNEKSDLCSRTPYAFHITDTRALLNTTHPFPTWITSIFEITRYRALYAPILTQWFISELCEVKQTVHLNKKFLSTILKHAMREAGYFCDEQPYKPYAGGTAQASRWPLFFGNILLWFFFPAASDIHCLNISIAKGILSA